VVVVCLVIMYMIAQIHLIEQVCELSEQALKKKNVLALIQENRHLPCPIMLLSMGSVVFGVKFCVVLNAGACR